MLTPTQDLRTPPTGAHRPPRVLMVCTGNICRSTMAEEVLRRAATEAGVEVVVDSAGVSDEEHGNPIDRRAARVLREAGYDVPDHRARQVHAEELGTWDLVLAMTRWHLDSLLRLSRRAGVRVRSYAGTGDGDGVDIRMYRTLDPALPPSLLSAGMPGAEAPRGRRPSYGDDHGELDVPDPWYGTHEDFVDTLAVLERTTPRIIEVLRGGTFGGAGAPAGPHPS